MKNAQSAKLSRRDWFRLRGPNVTQTTQQSSQEIRSQRALQPIEHPPNHDGMDLSELPPMREALLSDIQIDDLFSDIAQFASHILLMQRSVNPVRASTKSAPARASQATGEQMELARSSLLSGKLKRLQIRYCWQDALWIDTLTARDEGYHLVRITHQ